MSRLQGKVIIVTGSTTGIGKAIAKRCVAEGARVVVHGLETELAKQTVDELGDSAVGHVQNLLDNDCSERLLGVAINAFGRLDAVVNNAAWVATGTIADTDAERFEQFLTTNVVAPYRLIRTALPELRRQRGSVLNVGSVNAYAGEPNLLPYSVSKGALMTLTRNLGDTLMRTDGIRVNQINPGWVLTENESRRKREQGLDDDWYRDLPSIYAPSGRILLPNEIAAVAAFWLSDEIGPVSGQIIDLEQYPACGRNPAKDTDSVPGGVPCQD